MRKFFVYLFIGVMALAVAPQGALATPLTIVNPSFESNTPGDGGWYYPIGTVPNFVRAINDWNFTVAGNYYKGTHIFSGAQYPAVPHGSNAAYVTGGVDGGYIQQTVQGAFLTAGHIYTLSVYAGKRLDSKADVSYGLQLLAGGNLLAEKKGEVATLGTFELASLQYVPGSNDPYLGEPLEIKLWSFGGQSNFDVVTLNNAILAPTPIPGSVALMLSGLLGMSALGLRFRKN